MKMINKINSWFCSQKNWRANPIMCYAPYSKDVSTDEENVVRGTWGARRADSPLTRLGEFVYVLREWRGRYWRKWVCLLFITCVNMDVKHRQAMNLERFSLGSENVFGMELIWGKKLLNIIAFLPERIDGGGNWYSL